MQDQTYDFPNLPATPHRDSWASHRAPAAPDQSGPRSTRTWVTWMGCALAMLAMLGMTWQATAAGLDPSKEIAPFARRMASAHGMDHDSVAATLANARILDSVLKAMKRPAERMAWHRYRKIFLTQARIDGGVKFWHQHREVLEQAAAEYGVPVKVIVSIIGVETMYGTRKGKTRVIDALATLGFRYPRRAKFFRRELENFLLLAHEERLDPLRIKGSYAGAMGVPQFIPSSYRAYSVDFDGDGRRNLLDSPVDAIGSVAAYLSRHGWQRGAAIAARADVSGANPAPLVKKGLKPAITLARMRELGVRSSIDAAGGAKAALLKFDAEGGIEHWIGLRNFYAITRYNHSQLYALAVYQLAEAISGRHAQAGG